MTDPITVFTALKWDERDKALAQREGWDVFDCDSTGVLEIQKTEGSTFKTDSEARAFVAKMAAEGSARHLKALCMLAQQIVDDQLHTCCDAKDVADDIESAQREYNRHGSMCTGWCVDITSQLTILRSVI